MSNGNTNAKGATPGPWKVYERRIPHKLGGEHVERNIGTEHDHPQLKAPYPIAVIASGLGESDGSPAVQFLSINAADARLIAAAPALLEALEAIEMETRVGGQWTAAEINEVARAAIQSATGDAT